jgi:hypothetical protein
MANSKLPRGTFSEFSKNEIKNTFFNLGHPLLIVFIHAPYGHLESCHVAHFVNIPRFELKIRTFNFGYPF